MTSPHLTPIRDTLPDAVDALAATALAEGYDYLGTLAAEWRSGAERFTAPGTLLLAAWRDGALAGIGGLTLDPYDPHLGALRVRRFYVAPPHRRTGVGRHLAGALVGHGLGAAPLLTLRAVDARAAAFWESLGFHPDPTPNRTHRLHRPRGLSRGRARAYDTAMTTPAPVTRLDARFAELKARDRAAFVTFVTAGDPDPETSTRILLGLAGAGADVIELGMPFTDPMADGPAVQAAGLRALRAGMTLPRTLDMVRALRRQDETTPVILMGYFNPIHAYGVERFLADARAAGVDGLIVVDLPPEEDDELCLPAMAAGLAFIRLATPTTDEARLPAVLTNTSGFVYYVSITGITGSRVPDFGQVAAAVGRIKRHTDLPVCVGFGVRTAEHARAVAMGADGVVVGSALVDAVRASLDPDGAATDATVPAVLDLVRTIAAGAHAPREATGGQPARQAEPA